METAPKNELFDKLRSEIVSMQGFRASDLDLKKYVSV